MSEQNKFVDQIAWLVEQQAWAGRRVAAIKAGERVSRGAGNGPVVDVTEKHLAHYEKMAQRMADLIKAYEALDA